MSSALGVNPNRDVNLQSAAETPNVNVRPAPARKVVSQTRASVGPDLAEIKRAISTLFKKNQTIEIRVLDSRKKVALSGYYRDPDKLAPDVFSIAKRRNISAIYWTLQECDPALYSRSADAYLEHPSSTTNDHDIQRYRWLLIDCDPRRPEGICATDEEKTAAYEVALKVREYIRSFDALEMPNSILADSGNGFHVLVPIDLENSTESKALIQQTLVALDQRFSTEVVKIDTSVFNPSRVCKIYGTVVRKGSDTEERPHRQARLIDVPSNLPIFSREALEAIAETAIAEPTSTSNSSNNLDGPELEKKSAKMEQFLVEAKIKHRERLDYMGGFKWQLEACPFNPDHAAPDSFVSVAKTGALGFHCSHDSCSKNKWREFRKIAEKAIGHHFSFTDTQNQKAASSAQTAYEPPPAEVRPATFTAPVAAEIQTIKTPDMPDSVLVGRLGEIFDKYMRKDFPVGYGWLSLVTVAGTLVKLAPKHIRTNLYGCQVGPPGVGKTQSNSWSQTLLGMASPLLEKVMAGSSEGLVTRLRTAAGASRLLSVDELSHLLAKSKIDNASFPYILNQAYYENRFAVIAARSREIEFDCKLSILGCVVDDNFENSFGAASIGGLYDRFAFAQCPTGYQYDFRPCPHGKVLKELTEPVEVAVDPQVWEAKSAYIKEMHLSSRVFEIGLRVAAICASIDGRSVIVVDDLKPVLAFVQYQTEVRKVLQPNPGENVDGILASKFLHYIESHGSKGEWLDMRTMLRNTRAYDYGVGYQRVVDGLERAGEIEQAGRGIRGQKHLVRRADAAILSA